MMLFTTIICAIFLIHLISLPSSVHSKKINFAVIWNAPSEACSKKFNVSIPLDQYNIVHNKKEKFNGDKVVMFYGDRSEARPGLYPYVTDGGDGEVINGGIPQKVNILLHFARMRQDIDVVIPDMLFDGVAVIDWEEWRPLWETNWNKKSVYKRLSIDYVKGRHPELSDKSASAMAEQQFNKAARNLMVQTLRLAKDLRPLARWGFYGFPSFGDCDIKKRDSKCVEIYRKRNDEIQWLFDESVALYPTVYIHDSEAKWKQQDRHFHAQEIILETLRVNAENKRPFYLFTKFSYDPYADNMVFYEKLDICSTVKQGADFGAAGSLIWSCSKSVATAEKCKQIADYIDQVFGPIVSLVTQEKQLCSVMRCSSAGRCLLKEPQSSCSLALGPPFDGYECHCDNGFDGESCEKRQSSVP